VKNMIIAAVLVMLMAMMSPAMVLAEDDSSVGVSVWAEGDPDMWGGPMDNTTEESDWYGGIPGSEPDANAIIAAGGDEDTGSFD